MVDPPAFYGYRRRLGSVGRLELQKDDGDVVADSSPRESEPLGNFLVAQATGHKGKNLQLSPGQRLSTLVHRCPRGNTSGSVTKASRPTRAEPFNREGSTSAIIIRT